MTSAAFRRAASAGAPSVREQSAADRFAPPLTVRAGSFALAGYLRLVARTTRFDARLGPQPEGAAIFAMWHGQQLLSFAARMDERPVAALVSTHRDGALIGAVCARLGLSVIHGSGAEDPRQARRKRGAPAFRAMLRALADGTSVALTADVPKRARICGPGIIRLALHSGRPIYPLAVVTSRRIDLANWDRASIPLPFGRGAIVIGEPVQVPSDAAAGHCEDLRRRLETALDDAIAAAYGVIGHRDPGAGLIHDTAGEREAATGPSRRAFHVYR
ncbi:hypothetical protein GGR16_001010 [Chelatococcus caeni]|uniref:DUF374 domain-containing protein n=1 Tax=Chelatococcus caeni TaxID=1348468 RepID=A0A840BT44_9HYPH|nr:lysophospholipid acyltransferase family protein [Chelatococcus caeni]MBB4016004.1 hypothetical protein [Chelatococcus caeni]